MTNDKPCARCGACDRYASGKCKPCSTEKHRAWVAANKERNAENQRAYRAANAERIAEQKRAYSAANKEHLAEKKRAWLAANAERVAETRRAYRAANAERYAENLRAWRAANPERDAENRRAWREANPEYERDYRAANPEAIHRGGRRFRARKAGVPFEDYTLVQVAARCCGLCGICGERVDLDLSHPDPRSRSVDHIVPLSKGGPDTLANAQLAHFGCNAAKGDGSKGKRVRTEEAA